MQGININSIDGLELFDTYQEFKKHHNPTVSQFIAGYAVIIGYYLVTKQLPTTKHAWVSLKRQYQEQKSVIAWLQSHPNPGWGHEGHIKNKGEKPTTLPPLDLA